MKMKHDKGENGSNENIKSEYEYEEDPKGKEKNRSKLVCVFRL
jgi:hypothetical protein